MPHAPSSSTTAGDNFTMSSDGDTVTVNVGVTLTSTNGFAIVGTGSNSYADILGTISGGGGALLFGGSKANTTGLDIFVEDTGQVLGGAGLLAFGHGTHVTNNGLIDVTDTGVGLGGKDLDDTSFLVNNGTIHSGTNAVVKSGDSSENIKVTNYGEIKGDAYSYFAPDNALGSDTIINKGTMIGDVRFGLGLKHVFDGRGGTLDGDIVGSNGVNIIYAGKGDNRITTDSYDDSLSGGHGTDILDGQGKSDTFIFFSVNDSNAQYGTDTILHFNARADDVIDLHHIDANTDHKPGNQKFHFIGDQQFSHHAGELRTVYHAGGDLFVRGDVNGDGKPDIEILIDDSGHLTKLHAGDFIL